MDGINTPNIYNAAAAAPRGSWSLHFCYIRQRSACRSVDTVTPRTKKSKMRLWTSYSPFPLKVRRYVLKKKKAPRKKSLTYEDERTIDPSEANQHTIKTNQTSTC